MWSSVSTSPLRVPAGEAPGSQVYPQRALDPGGIRSVQTADLWNSLLIGLPQILVRPTPSDPETAYRMSKNGSVVEMPS
jgi:hypothetical protein